MKTPAQLNAEAFVKHLIKRNQPLSNFEFEAWTRKGFFTGAEWIPEQRWFSVSRGDPKSSTHPRICISYIAPEGDSMDAFQSAVAVAVMQAL